IASVIFVDRVGSGTKSTIKEHNEDVCGLFGGVALNFLSKPYLTLRQQLSTLSASTMSASTFTPLSFPADKPLVTLTRSGPVFLLKLDNGDNRFTVTSIAAINAALDIVERAFKDEGYPALALVTTGKEKFYSNGLDLEHAMATPRFMEDHYLKLLSRMVTFPVPTVAALNGLIRPRSNVILHPKSPFSTSFAVTRSLEGACSPLPTNEVDFGAPIPAGMMALMRHKLRPHTFRDMVLLGRRFNGPEALEHNIVDEIVKGSEEDVLKQAVAMAVKVSAKSKSAGVCFKWLKDEVDIPFDMNQPKKIKRSASNADNFRSRDVAFIIAHIIIFLSDLLPFSFARSPKMRKTLALVDPQSGEIIEVIAIDVVFGSNTASLVDPQSGMILEVVRMVDTEKGLIVVGQADCQSLVDIGSKMIEQRTTPVQLPQETIAGLEKVGRISDKITDGIKTVIATTVTTASKLIPTLPPCSFTIPSDSALVKLGRAVANIQMGLGDAGAILSSSVCDGVTGIVEQRYGSEVSVALGSIASAVNALYMGRMMVYFDEDGKSWPIRLVSIGMFVPSVLANKETKAKL
ncbi:ClpP/crotonase-like domain-containing protein, partial [Jimgerdemannia flammicorona]